MTISKTTLRKAIEHYQFSIESHKEESKEYPHMKGYNDMAILKLQGKIEAYKDLLNIY